MQTATKLKLECVSELVKSYADARTALVNFLNQQGHKFDLDDPLEGVSSEYLDVLYKDYGRESFWTKQKGEACTKKLLI